MHRKQAIILVCTQSSRLANNIAIRGAVRRMILYYNIIIEYLIRSYWISWSPILTVNIEK